MKRTLAALHDRLVMSRRVRVLASHLARRIPPNATVLDVGSGDGRLASLVARARPDISVSGVDVLIRTRTAIPTLHYDGLHLPFADASMDVVMLIDVLHHAAEPDAVLREAARVARHSVLVKDHRCEGPIDAFILRCMDWVGNAPHGVALTYRYLSEEESRAAFSAARLRVADWQDDLGLYPWPFSLVFGRSLHMLVSAIPVHGALPADGS